VASLTERPIHRRPRLQRAFGDQPLRFTPKAFGAFCFGFSVLDLGLKKGGRRATKIGQSRPSNAAVTPGGGVIPGGPTRIFNNTIANNSAATSGGVRNASGFDVTSKNSIIAKNTASTADPDFSGDLTSQSFNLIGNNSGAIIMPAQFSDQIGTPGSSIDPLLGPLQNNGGPTPTLALLSGSTAIDQGGSAVDPITGNPIITDQRGFTRPFDNPGIANATGGDGSDIGAFEAQVTLLGNISTRAFVQTGDNVMIGGFIITGSGQKKVIVRAIGPSLVNHGITNPLQYPTLELHNGERRGHRIQRQLERQPAGRDSSPWFSAY